MDERIRILKPVSRIDASYLLKAQASYYPNFVRVVILKNDVFKMLPNLERRHPVEYEPNPYGPDKEDALARSLRRTRKTIKDYAFCNSFDLFATFTMAVDREDEVLVKKRMTNWVKNESKRKGKFQYLFVPEFHKDQKSLHFHALLKNYKGEVKQSYKDNGKPLLQKGRPVFTLPSYTQGFTNVKKIDDDKFSATKVGFYLQKYITKDFPVFFGKNRYWASHGLKKPVIQDNPEKWYLTVEPSREYESDYGRIIEFDHGKSPLIDMFIEANQP